MFNECNPKQFLNNRLDKSINDRTLHRDLTALKDRKVVESKGYGHTVTWSLDYETLTKILKNDPILSIFELLDEKGEQKT